MESAAISAHQSQENEDTGESIGEDQSQVQRAAYVRDDGKIYLAGNPLKTTRQILCPTCGLPRLLYPTTGKGSRAPEPGKEYCARQPYIDKDGCDIHGKSLTIEKPTKKAKTAKDAKKQSEPSPDGSESPTTSPPNEKVSDTPAATSIPTTKCPNCPRYMAFTRIAQHLDRCMGLSGRQSSKNAMTRMNTGTPRDSRATTPKPQALVKKRKLDKSNGDETEENTPKKKTKLVQKKKVGEMVPKGKAMNTNVERVRGAEKRLPGQSSIVRKEESVENDLEDEEEVSLHTKGDEKVAKEAKV